jgi:hypothetical protein
MPTHLYCLLPAGSSAAPPAPVRAVVVRSVVAWVGEAESPRLSRDARDAARAAVDHDRVIGAALTQGMTPVPAALADPYQDDAEMAADVDSHAKDIEALFPAFAGMVEMTTIMAVHDDAPTKETPNRGRAYLEQLRSLPARAADVAARVERGMSQFPHLRRRAEGGRVALSHLVPFAAAQDYRAVALGLAADGYRMVVDGPRAPYSFGVFAPRRGVMTEMSLGGTILAT